MKILQINAVNDTGSTGRTSREVADYLNSNGHEGLIAHATGTKYYKGYIIGTSLDHKKHALLSRVTGKQAYFSKKSTIGLIKYIEKEKPDVIHLRNLHSNFINIEILCNFLAINDIPTVITLHDCWFYTGKCTHYTTDNCYKWQVNCGNCPRLKKDNPSWFFDMTSVMLNDKKRLLLNIPRLAVIGVSDWITDEARKSFLSSAKILTRIYNWIDLEVFKPRNDNNLKVRLGLKDKFITLGVASGWSNAKGLDKFIKLAGIAPKDMQIVLVGNLNDKISLPENITHIATTNNVSELAEYYSMADVYLHLSLEETFGKTIAEAMACGTPTVVYDSTACPEVVGSECGYIIKPGKIEDILATINKIRTFPKSNFSEKCLLRVNELFNSEKNINKTIDLYKKIIEI